MDRKLEYAVLLLISGSESHVGSFWASIGILSIPLYFSLQISLAALKCLVYSVNSSSSLCLVVIRFIMVSIITISAIFLSLNDKEFSLIASCSFIGLPLILDLYLPWLLFYAAGLLCIVQREMHMLSTGSCNDDFFT